MLLRLFKYFLIAVCLITAFYAFAGDRYYIKTAAGGTTWTIAGTAADTSVELPTKGTMTIAHYAADSIAADSVNIELDFQMLGAVGFFSVRKCTLSVDSTDDDFMITNTAVPSLRIYRIVATGLAGNRTLGNGVRLKMRFEEGN